MFKPNQAKSEPTGWGGHSCLPTLVGVADKNVDTTSDWSGLVQNVAEARLNLSLSLQAFFWRSNLSLAQSRRWRLLPSLWITPVAIDAR